MIRILIATDYSENVMNAERYALELCSALKAKVKFLHVNSNGNAPEVTPFDAELNDHDPFNSNMNKLKDHVTQLFFAIQKHESEFGHELMIREGNIAEEVCDEARAWKADLLVIGAHWHGSRLMAGNKSWQIVKESATPVLIIPNDALFNGIHEITFAADYSEGEADRLDQIIPLAKNFKVNINILHVCNFTFLREAEEEHIKRFSEEVKKKIPYKRIHLRLAHNPNIAEGIRIFCSTKPTDVLVMSPKKISKLNEFLFPAKNITKKVSVETHTPLLILPPVKDKNKLSVDQDYIKKQFSKSENSIDPIGFMR